MAALALLSALVAAPAAAQVEGRWAMFFGGGATGALRARGRAIGFTAAADGRLRFTGELHAGALRGVAVADSGTPRIWSAAPLSPASSITPSSHSSRYVR